MASASSMDCIVSDATQVQSDINDWQLLPDSLSESFQCVEISSESPDSSELEHPSITATEVMLSSQDVPNYEYDGVAQLSHIPLDNQTLQDNREFSTPVDSYLYEPMMMMSDSGLQPDMRLSAESTSARLNYSTTQDSLFQSSSTVDERDFENILAPDPIPEPEKGDHELFETTILPGNASCTHLS